MVAEYCYGLPGYMEGMRLLVMGGLRRGFALGFEKWPDRWRVSVIRVSDLITLRKVCYALPVLLKKNPIF